MEYTNASHLTQISDQHSPVLLVFNIITSNTVIDTFTLMEISPDHLQKVKSARLIIEANIFLFRTTGIYFAHHVTCEYTLQNQPKSELRSTTRIVPAIRYKYSQSV